MRQICTPQDLKVLAAAGATALIVACVGGWVISDTQARVATPATVQIDPIHADDERQAAAHRALCRLFLRVLSGSFLRPTASPGRESGAFSSPLPASAVAPLLALPT